MAVEFSLRAPKGTFDTLPPEGEALLQVRNAMAEGIARAGYAYIETPVLEDTAVFVRGVGESTDVVSKEMYTFSDRGNDFPLNCSLICGPSRSRNSSCGKSQSPAAPRILIVDDSRIVRANRTSFVL